MNCTIVILSGGLATRLRPITDTIQKALVPIHGRPFVEWQMELLRKEGMTDVIMCTGYKGEMLESSVGDGLGFGIHARYSRDGSRLLGTGGALLEALPRLSDPFMVLSGDSYLVADYGQILNSFLVSRKQPK